MGQSVLLAAFVVLAALVAKPILGCLRDTRRYPPGPKRRPIIGNILDIPAVRPWEKYHEWSTLHNTGLLYLHIPSRPVIVVGSTDVANELFEKRSNLYSDRPVSVVLEMMAWDWNVALMPYGPRWRAHRRVFHQHFSPSMISKYFSIQVEEARALLMLMLQAPNDTRRNVRRAITSTILRVVYGVRISGMDDELVQLVEKAAEGGNLAIKPGAYLVEFFPIFKHVPAWVPGADAAKLAKKYRPSVLSMRNKTYDEIKEKMTQSSAPPSMSRTLIQQIQTEHMDPDDASLQEEIAQNVTAISYAAGADATASSAETFILAMAMYPEVQRKAQEQLDKVVGPNRLPDFGDLDSLPYLRAIAMEVVRWMPPLPLGMPHLVTKDDHYHGYFIPKGTVLLPNAWAMLRNAEDYPDPESFNPDRFIGPDGAINPNVRDPDTIAFGFGRRSCPGLNFSNNTVHIFIASILHAFNIAPSLDENGHPVQLSAKFITSLITAPVDLSCTLTPRSPQAECLVREAALVGVAEEH